MSDESQQNIKRVPDQNNIIDKEKKFTEVNEFLDRLYAGEFEGIVFQEI